MKVYVVVEMFLGTKVPEIKGVYKDKEKAEEIKDNCRFAFISEQYLIQDQSNLSKQRIVSLKLKLSLVFYQTQFQIVVLISEVIK